MKKILTLAVLLWAGWLGLANAADNAVTLTTGSGVTMRTIDIGAGVQSSVVILGSSAGAAIYGTAGTANANVLTIQGIASGTVVPVSLTSTTITGTVAATQSGTWNIGTVTTVTGVTTVSTVTAVTTLTGGGVASGSADSGNPVKIGGKYNSSPVTLTDGNRGDLQLDVNGYLNVDVKTATGLAAGSTTSGQTGSLIMGAVTTAAPSYTNAQTNNLSLTTAGALRSDLSTIAGTAAVNGSGTATGALRVELPTNGTGVVGLNAGTALVGKVGVDQTTPGTTNGVAIVGVNAATALAGNGVTGTGSQRVTIASDNTPFSVKIDQTTPGTTNAIQDIPGTTGGLSAYFVQPTASDNHVVIKAGAGQVYHMSVMNNSATVNYLRLYNATTGFNGCNSATNLVGQWQIPGNTAVGGYTVNFLTGLAFATGISICVTSGYATTDTTNATASAMSVNVGYK